MKSDRWYFLIKQSFLDEYVRIQGLAALMYMLRYEGATVESGGPDGYYTLSAARVHEKHWASYGIKIHGPWVSNFERIGIPYELTKWAEGGQ